MVLCLRSLHLANCEYLSHIMTRIVTVSLKFRAREKSVQCTTPTLQCSATCYYLILHICNSISTDRLNLVARACKVGCHLHAVDSFVERKLSSIWGATHIPAENWIMRLGESADNVVWSVEMANCINKLISNHIEYGGNLKLQGFVIRNECYICSLMNRRRRRLSMFKAELHSRYCL